MNPYPYYGPPSNMSMQPPNMPPNMIPQQRPNMPPNMMLQPVQYVFVQDPMGELANCTGVLIKQEPELFEQLTGCETANRYHVFGQTHQGSKYLFKCKEKSGWCMRNCCASKQREFDMDIIHISSPNQMQNYSKSFANAYKPFKCTMGCLCRPELIVSLNDGNIKVGSAIHACTICNPEFEILDSNNQIKYIVSASCCQAGLIFPNSLCGKCYEVAFDIMNPGTSEVVGHIIKKTAELDELVTDADSYQVNFPQNASPYDKLLIIALGLMIDYQYFETDSKSEEEKRRRREGRLGIGRSYNRRY